MSFFFLVCWKMRRSWPGPKGPAVWADFSLSKSNIKSRMTGPARNPTPDLPISLVFYLGNRGNAVAARENVPIPESDRIPGNDRILEREIVNLEETDPAPTRAIATVNIDLVTDSV